MESVGRCGNMKAPLANIHGTPLVALVTFTSWCGFLLFGFDNGVFSGLLVLPWYIDQFGHPDAALTGALNAMYNVGGFLGGVVCFFIGRWLGRRRTILLGLLATAVGAIIQCTSLTVAQLIVGRILGGTGVGMMTSTLGLWVAEVSPPQTRGKYLIWPFVVNGLVFAQWINYGMSAYDGRVAFAFPLAFQLVFIIASAVLILSGLPESPRWLYREGKRQEALAVLIRLEPGSNTVEREDRAKRRYLEIVESVELEGLSRNGHNKALFAGGPTQNFQRLGLACTTMIFHQLTGINTITYYMPTLLVQFIGASRSQSLWITALLSIDSMVATFINVFIVDKVGRKPLLWAASLWQAINFAIIAGLLSGELSHGKSVAVVVMIFIFYGVNSLSWLGITWAYPSEILPLQIRENGLAIANSLYWMFQVCIVEITPVGIQNIGYKFYIIFTVFNFVMFLVILFWFPETKGKSLEQIDFYFASRYHGGQELHEVEERVAQQKDQIVDEQVEAMPGQVSA